MSFQEKTGVLQSFKDRAKLVADTFNSMEGIQCNEVMGAMYAFPQVFMPKKAQEEAKVKSGNCFHNIFIGKILERKTKLIRKTPHCPRNHL